MPYAEHRTPDTIHRYICGGREMETNKTQATHINETVSYERLLLHVFGRPRAPHSPTFFGYAAREHIMLYMMYVDLIMPSDMYSARVKHI